METAKPVERQGETPVKRISNTGTSSGPQLNWLARTLLEYDLEGQEPQKILERKGEILKYFLNPGNVPLKANEHYAANLQKSS